MQRKRSPLSFPEPAPGLGDLIRDRLRVRRNGRPGERHGHKPRPEEPAFLDPDESDERRTPRMDHNVFGGRDNLRALEDATSVTVAPRGPLGF